MAKPRGTALTPATAPRIEDCAIARRQDKMKEKYDTLSAADKAALLELYVSAGRY